MYGQGVGRGGKDFNSIWAPPESFDTVRNHIMNTRTQTNTAVRAVNSIYIIIYSITKQMKHVGITTYVAMEWT